MTARGIRLRRFGLLAVAPVGLMVALAHPMAAGAATPSHWAQWSAPTGTSHAFTGTVTVPARAFPAVSWTSDSRSPVQVPTGASTYLNAATPPGAKYGSSQGSAYLNLRPYADNATSPSTTTFDFATATPTAGWTFVLGDIDADKVHIEARDANGRAVPDADIDQWERGSFNYAGGSDRPTWQPGTATLTGNAAAADTSGASDWFEPDRALSSLTFVFTQRAGFPVFQIWFAALTHDVSGLVTGAAGCAAGAATVHLLAPDGTELDSTQPASDGRYTFAGLAAQPGYTVRVDAPATPPDACLVSDPAGRSVDLSGSDASADFALRDVGPNPVAGTVTANGDGVAGVTVTLTPPGSAARTTTTDDAGHYEFDGNNGGARYHVAVTAPPGYATQDPAEHTFDITPGTAVPDQDFVLSELPAISGTVTATGHPLESVPVMLVDPGGHHTTTVTDPAGGYVFPGLSPGRYSVAVTAPDGYLPAQDREGVVIASSDITGQDFALARAGSVSGDVTSADDPLTGVAVSLDGPAGTQSGRTAADGSYLFDDLTPGDYTVTVHAPTGYRVDGTRSHAVTVTDAGELRGGLNFTLVRSTAPTSTPTPTPTSTPTSTPAPPVTGMSEVTSAGSGGAGADDLADTGTQLAAWSGLAAALLAAGTVLLVVSRRRHD